MDDKFERIHPPARAGNSVRHQGAQGPELKARGKFHRYAKRVTC